MTDDRRLYTVTVTVHYVVRATDEKAALKYANEAPTGIDLTNNCEVARTVRLLPDGTFSICYPEKPDGTTIWDDQHVDGGCAINQAIDDEKAALLAERTFQHRQRDLFEKP